MLKNKYVKLAALVLASFAIINVGMYFFLKMTQPKMGARIETGKLAEKSAADSTTHAEPVASTDPAHLDTTAASKSQPPVAQTVADTAKSPPPVTASLAAPPEPSMPSPPEPDKTLSSVDSTPVADAAKPDTKSSETAVAAVGDEKQMAKLAKLLESVKPGEAATIAARLDTDQIVALVMKMKDRSAGKMLAAMPPEQAAKIALRMSEMATATRGRP